MVEGGMLWRCVSCRRRVRWQSKPSTHGTSAARAPPPHVSLTWPDLAPFFPPDRALSLSCGRGGGGWRAGMGGTRVM